VPLDRTEIDKWVKRTLDELTDCFGGASPLNAPGTNMLDGRVLYERDQVIVVSACDSREEFLRHQKRIETFAETMCRDLRQHSVIVLACPSDSFLVESVARPETSP